MVATAHYDTGGRPGKEVLATDMFVLLPTSPLPIWPSAKLTRFPPPQLSKTLSSSLQTLYDTAANPIHPLPQIPPELVKYVEGGRNPDIYTREFVELVRRGNQLMRGKMHAFAQFRDVLAEQVGNAMPELRSDVVQVLEATGARKGDGSGADEPVGGRPSAVGGI